ncbi:MAG: SGNH/GDSL hydrolase family protein [Deltaproteobacteria bacterium]|nr:SGNH/GDSL hydrolase family protein [Deltaproteobacteria bacterium]
MFRATPKQLPAKLFVASLSLVLTAALLEVGLRGLDWRGYHQDRQVIGAGARRAKEDRIPFVWPLYLPHAELAFRYDGNPRGYFDDDSTLRVRLNNHGFRGTDHPKAKRPDLYRVMVVGDSFTFGEGVRWEHTFVYRLGEELRKRVGPGIEVLDFGVGSWGTRSQYHYLVHEGMEFDPDLILLVFTPNDAEYAGGLDVWENFRQLYTPPPALRASHLLSLVYANWVRIVEGRRYIEELVKSAMEEQEKWNRTLDFLTEIGRLAESSNSKFAIAIFPFMIELDEDYPLGEIHGLVSERAQRDGTPYLDLLPRFLGRRYTDLWVHPTDQHPNETAHAIASDALADFLVERGLVRSPTNAGIAQPAP